MKGNIIYKYIGNGASIAGVPARDLTEAEALECGLKYVLSCGLYRKEAVKDNLEVQEWHKE